MPFSDIYGHDRNIELFKRAIRTGKTAHAYLFEGPSGCGKKKSAVALIQALFCQSADDDACGSCPSCRKIEAGNHADIHLIEPLPEKRDINIAQLRELQRELALRPYEAPRKACIIEPADRMNVNSANSFLKTLEEPPGNAIIIMITENADMLLPTIRSRCQTVRFAPLSPEHLQLLLEKNGIEASQAAIMAQLSEGSMQKALELDNESLSQRRSLFIKYLTSFSLQQIATVFDASEELSGNRDETVMTLDMILSLARDLIHLASGSNDIINIAIRPTLENLSERLDLKRSLQLAEEILETRRSVQRNANIKLALDNLFIKIAALLHPEQMQAVR